ncbi:hypothetical protein [Nocardia pseudovaccinii]|uniref:hypothetical protein n=1 Tax=Nocardia pseudovaccinii TaxID=189540 RepID=UPI0007A40901|nr:hypothetical protein [Nocardia pseudovaccinii]
MSEHHTEVGGWLAEWQIDHHRIRIMLVHSGSESHPLMSASAPAAAPDLARMREQFPDLSPLWDAIRHEYWAEFFITQEHSQGTV